MKSNYYYSLNIEVHFTNAEIKLITKTLLQSEYKYEVTAFDGFWSTYIRIRKYFRDGKKEYHRELTFRQLDKILKTFEIYTNGWVKNDLALKIAKYITNILKTINQATSQRNKTTKIIFN